MKMKYSIALIVFLTSLIFAQSDLQIVENFKSEHKLLEISIEQSKSTSETAQRTEEVKAFKEKYAKHKQLLDKSLYPDNYSQMIVSLERKIQVSADRIARSETAEQKTEVLQQEVAGLTEQVNQMREEIRTLKEQNNTLIAELKELKRKKQTETAKYKELTTKVKDNIKKRDELIDALVDDVFGSIGPNQPITPDEQQKTIIKIENANVIDNIVSLAVDNIAYINSGSFKPGDFSELDSYHKDFNQKWSDLRPKLETVYSNTAADKNKFTTVDKMIADWGRNINRKIWDQIHSIYDVNNIVIENFRSSEEFYQNNLQYIESAIKNIPNLPVDSVTAQYDRFVTNVWDKEVSSEWIPLLMERNMLTSAQRDTLDARIVEWQKQAGVSTVNWTLIGSIIVLAAAILILIVVRMRSSKKPVNPKANEKTAEKEDDSTEA